MAAKPRITIVGAGNLATALAVALRNAGYVMDEVIARANRRSLTRARSLARKVGARAVTLSSAQIRSEIVWFCVPDSEIANAAGSLASSALLDSKDGWQGKVALHSSGALSSDELQLLRKHGAAVASVHPLMTFVHDSRPSLAGVSFAIEGDPRAIRMAKRVVRDLRGQSYLIRKQDKVIYHACGTFASPLLTALLATTEHLAIASGMERKAARRRLLPILRQTLANYGRFGAAKSFSGPLVRGDSAVVAEHLKQLRSTPIARDVYVALARAALQLLPAKNRVLLEKVLS